MMCDYPLPEGAELRRLCDVPKGWEWQNDAGNWHPARRFGAEDECTGYVLCRPLPVPAPPATEKVPWWEAVGRKDVNGRPIIRVQANYGVRPAYTIAGAGQYPVLADGMVEVLVDSAPTGDDEPLCENLGCLLDPHHQGNCDYPAGDEPQTAPASQGRWIVATHIWGGDHKAGDGLPLWETSERDLLDPAIDKLPPEAIKALVDLVRRDGTDPTPYEVSRRVTEQINGGSTETQRLIALRSLLDEEGPEALVEAVLAAVRALQNGGAR